MESINRAYIQSTGLLAFLGFCLVGLFTVGYADTTGLSVDLLPYSSWDGLLPADVFLPSLLLGMGVQLWFLKTKHPSFFLPSVFKLGLTFLLVGLLVSFFVESGFAFAKWRYFGLLQRLGLVFLLGGVLLFFCSKNQLWLVAGLLLLGYNGLISSCGDLTIEGNAVRRLEVYLFGELHLFQGFGNANSIVFEPFGLLGVIPSVCTLVLGYYVGVAMDYFDKKLDQLLLVMVLGGLVLIAFGLFVHEVLPINGSLWSTAFVLTTGGIAVLALSLFIYGYDVLRMTIGSRFFLCLGANVGFALVVHIVLTKVLLAEFLGRESAYSLMNVGLTGLALPALVGNLILTVGLLACTYSIVYGFQGKVK